jgi:cell division protein FtsQ
MASEQVVSLKPSSKPRKKKRKEKNNLKWLLLGLIFFMLILLIVFFSSSLSRVQTITVNGEQLISEAEIIKASKILINDQYLFTFTDEIVANVKKLGSIEDVRVIKKFPGVIQLEIKEYLPVAYILRVDGERDVVLANGKRLPASSEMLLDKPILSGFADAQMESKLSQMTEALIKVDRIHLNDLSEIVPVKSKTYSDKIQIFTRSGYEVFTTIQYFPKKIIHLQEIIGRLKAKDIQDGYINLLEADHYSPFKTEAEDESTTQTEQEVIE